MPLTGAFLNQLDAGTDGRMCHLCEDTDPAELKGKKWSDGLTKEMAKFKTGKTVVTRINKNQ